MTTSNTASPVADKTVVRTCPGRRRLRVMGRLRRGQRQGLSLLEVILAIAILGGSLAVIGELIRIGTISAGRAEHLSKAQLIAESRISEVTSGAHPLQGVSQSPSPEDDSWLYTIDVAASETEGLLYVEVTVEQDSAQYANPLSIKIGRLLVDPQYVEELIAEAEAAAEIY